MAYLRYSSILPSGKESTCYVYPNGKGLVNFDKAIIPNKEMLNLLDTNLKDIKKAVKRRLKVTDEEAEVIAERLLSGNNTRQFFCGQDEDETDLEVLYC